MLSRPMISLIQTESAKPSAYLSKRMTNIRHPLSILGNYAQKIIMKGHRASLWIEVVRTMPLRGVKSQIFEKRCQVWITYKRPFYNVIRGSHGKIFRTSRVISNHPLWTESVVTTANWSHWEHGLR